jgi:protein-tyrosine phosphatase
MSTEYTRVLPIAGTYNVRDLGGYAAAHGETRWRRMLRADSLHRVDQQGIAALLDAGVTTVIDLRQADELAHQPNPLAKVPAVAYHNVSLFEGLAPDVMGPTDVLFELYKMALRDRQPVLARVLRLIADAPAGTVLFHCTAGKDRTGIVAALLLGMGGASREIIVQDYSLTAALIAPMVADMTAGAVARGVDPATFARVLASDPETMVATIDFIETEFGSLAAYLDGMGLETETIARLRNRLVGEA